MGCECYLSSTIYYDTPNLATLKLLAIRLVIWKSLPFKRHQRFTHVLFIGFSIIYLVVWISSIFEFVPAYMKLQYLRTLIITELIVGIKKIIGEAGCWAYHKLIQFVQCIWASYIWYGWMPISPRCLLIYVVNIYSNKRLYNTRNKFFIFIYRLCLLPKLNF